LTRSASVLTATARALSQSEKEHSGQRLMHEAREPTVALLDPPGTRGLARQSESYAVDAPDSTAGTRTTTAFSGVGSRTRGPAAPGLSMG
jgi:hypothetical protein